MKFRKKSFFVGALRAVPFFKIPAIKFISRTILFSGLLFLLCNHCGYTAPPMAIPRINIGITPSQNPQEVALSLQIFMLMTILTLAPAFVMLLTSFTRIVIVLSFLRQALGTQMIPPNQILISLALFMTFLIMSPTISEINKTAYKPYLEQKITQKEAISKAMEPIRGFMFRQTREKDIALFMKAANLPAPKKKKDVPNVVLIPAFAISELKTGFEMGFALFIAFIVIDMVIASILMSLGMMMLPPMMISLPLKVLLFVMADGWHLVVKSLIESFR